MDKRKLACGDPRCGHYGEFGDCNKQLPYWPGYKTDTSGKCIDRNPDGLCEHHTGRKTKDTGTFAETCHWCKAGLMPAEHIHSYRQDHRLKDVYDYVSCPTCTTKHVALLDSMEHWTEIPNMFIEHAPADHMRWFRAYCGPSDCACCKAFSGNTIYCHDCPLGNAGNRCCDGAWNVASQASLRGDLRCVHLTAVRDYIRDVCVKEGIVEKKERPPVHPMCRVTCMELLEELKKSDKPQGVCLPMCRAVCASARYFLPCPHGKGYKVEEVSK